MPQLECRTEKCTVFNMLMGGGEHTREYLKLACNFLMEEVTGPSDCPSKTIAATQQITTAVRETE